MVNKDYYKAKYKKLQYLPQFSIHTNQSFSEEDADRRIYDDMGVFFNITDKIIKEIIKNALKSLKNRSLILYSENFKISKVVPLEGGKSFITQSYICTPDQKKEFLNIRKAVMRDHDIKKLQDIIYMQRDQREKYFDDLKTKMAASDILLNCSRYANAFDITYGDKAVQYEYQHLLEENQYYINNNMQYKLLTTQELECINNALKSQFVNTLIG